jgi:high-affinity iron transporter
MILNIFPLSLPLALALLGGPPTDPGPVVQRADLPAVVRRLAATTQLAAQEYRIGVVNGKVIAAAEVEEAELFLREARVSAGRLPPDAASGATREIDAIIALVRATAPPDTVAGRVRVLTSGLAARFGVDLEQLPAIAPSLARGAEVYGRECASCHGSTGRGDGPGGRGLTPPPAVLSDAIALGDATPLDYFRRVTIGVAGTAMPAYETRLTADDRWAAAVYATFLRYPAPAGEVPASLRAFTATARLSDRQIADILGVDPNLAGARIAAARAFELQAHQADAAPVFALVRAQLDSAAALLSTGQREAAGTLVFDAYMSFEQVEAGVRAKVPSLAGNLEAGFTTLRGRAQGGATAAELQAIRAELDVDLARAERILAKPLGPAELFMQSFVILLREGLEAILIIGALVAFLMRTGNGQRRRDIHLGVGAGVVVTLLTLVAIETVFQLSPASQEVLEGVTMLVATAVLFYVSYWLLSKLEVAKWNRFVKGKVQDALTSGSALALPSVAFLAVYREGVETVLFYKALLLTGAPGHSVLPVLGGIACAALVLAIIYVLINRFGVKLPLKAFFGVTSAFLYYMAFVFAGKGVAELQGGGVLPVTVVPWAPQVERFGIYRTVESLAVQGLLAALLLAALIWTFYLEPRRLRVTQQLVPDSSPRAPEPPPAETASTPLETDILRSLERMDADLAELRAEVERLKARLLARR